MTENLKNRKQESPVKNGAFLFVAKGIVLHLSTEPKYDHPADQEKERLILQFTVRFGENVNQKPWMSAIPATPCQQDQYLASGSSSPAASLKEWLLCPWSREPAGTPGPA